MMSVQKSRKCLQAFMGVLGLIPLLTSCICFFLGPEGLPGGMQTNATIDSEIRFLGVMWMGFGLTVYWLIPRIEKHTQLVRFLAALVFFGGVGRLISLVVAGTPHPLILAVIPIEIIVVPLLVPWHNSVVKGLAAESSKPN